MKDNNIEGRTSESYEEVIGDDGYTDKVWNVTDENGVEYHIIDDYAWRGETLQNSLTDDYEYSVLTKLEPEHSYEVYGDISNQYATVVYAFETLDDIDKAIQDLNSLTEQLSQYKNFSLSDVRYSIQYTNQYTQIYDSSDSQDIRLSGYLDDTTIDESDIQKVINDSQECQIQFGDCDSPILQGLSEDDIGNLIETQENKIVDITDPENTVGYPVLAMDRRDVIQFGELYNLLKNSKKDFSLNGDFEHYTFVGVDDKTYEVQYSLNDLDLTQFGYENHVNSESDTGYFYIVDETPVPCNLYFENWFDFNKVYDMTGIKIDKTKNL